MRCFSISHSASRTNQRGSFSSSRSSTWRRLTLSYCFITSSRSVTASFCSGRRSNRFYTQTLTSPVADARPFEIIFDWTSFSSSSQVPMQWLKYCIEIIPHDFRARFETAYILNPNSAAIKYLRRLWNITAGA
jgi:hypothetical protein